jgi:origin recognition complex subunit 6
LAADAHSLHIINLNDDGGNDGTDDDGHSQQGHPYLFHVLSIFFCVNKLQHRLNAGLMSNIEQSLALILPSLSDRLPSELVDLAKSLLAQSLNKASNLKGDEEIARPYACAEIACKRLTTKLKLPAPALQGRRPPCPPRVYKKLLAFLEQALQQVKVRPAKPRGSDDAFATDLPDNKRPARSTPTTTKKKTFGPSSSSRKRTAHDAFAGEIAPTYAKDESCNDDGAPVWAMPLIRRLCKALSTPLLVPHVYTGLCVVLRLADLHPDHPSKLPVSHTSTYRHQTTTLTLALFFLVLSRMQRDPVSTETYTADCAVACATANEPNAHIPSSDPNMHFTSTVITQPAIDAWIKKISAQNWTTDQDWWNSVPKSRFSRRTTSNGNNSIENHEAEAEADSPLPTHHPPKPTFNTLQPPNKTQRETKKSKKGTSTSHSDQPNPQATDEDSPSLLLPGLGTMMQDAVDWTGEDRRSRFVEWKQVVDRRVGLALALVAG